MTTTIKLVNDKTTVWQINKSNNKQDKEFVDGFLYGGLFLLNDLPSHYFVEETRFARGLYIYSVLDNLKINRDFLGHTYIPLAEIQDNNDIIAGYYTVWLRDPMEEGEANSVTFKSPPFLQGLFTVLDLAKIPYERVVLHKPIKDGITYNVQGLNLPNLKDITRQ